MKNIDKNGIINLGQIEYSNLEKTKKDSMYLSKKRNK